MVLDQQQVLFRVSGFKKEVVDHVSDHPEFASLLEVDNPTMHRMTKDELARVVCCKVLPHIMEAFNYYDDKQELFWECGTADQLKIDSVISDLEMKRARSLIRDLMRSLPGSKEEK